MREVEIDKERGRHTEEEIVREVERERERKEEK